MVRRNSSASTLRGGSESATVASYTTLSTLLWSSQSSELHIDARSISGSAWSGRLSHADRRPVIGDRLLGSRGVRVVSAAWCHCSWPYLIR